jgi:putative membrane protein
MTGHFAVTSRLARFIAWYRSILIRSKINLAASKGWTIPASLQAREQANLDKLNASTSATFDKDFATIMVASHNDAIALFNIAGGSEGVRDGQLRAFAASKLSALNSHLAEATALLTTVNQP